MSIFRVTYAGAPDAERYRDTDIDGIQPYELADDAYLETAWIVEGADVTEWIQAAVLVDRGGIAWENEAQRTVAVARVTRGECVWHAAATAMGRPCPCAACAGPVPVAFPDDDIDETRIFGLATA